MTVKDLIARLETFDPTPRVIMPSDVTQDFCEVEQAFVDTVQIRGTDVQLADELEDEELQSGGMLPTQVGKAMGYVSDNAGVSLQGDRRAGQVASGSQA